MKNRYCRRTKLSEETFFVIIHCFCSGMTATETQKACKSWKLKVSRQTVERKFLELGRYIYQKNVKTPLLASYRKLFQMRGSDKAVEKALLDNLWMNMRGKLDFERYRSKGTYYPGSRALMTILRQRWLAFKGFRRKTFPSHIGFAVFSNLEVEKQGIEIAIESLRQQLEDDPL